MRFVHITLSIILVLIASKQSQTIQITCNESVFLCQLRALRQKQDALTMDDYFQLEMDDVMLKFRLKNSSLQINNSRITISLLNLTTHDIYKVFILNFQLHKDKNNSQLFQILKQQHDKLTISQKNQQFIVLRSTNPEFQYIKIYLQKKRIKYRLRDWNQKSNAQITHNNIESNKVQNKRMQQLQKRLKLVEFYSFNDLKKWGHFQFLKIKDGILISKISETKRYQYFINAVPILNGTIAKFYIKERKSMNSDYKIGVGINTACQQSYNDYKSLMNYWSMGYIQKYNADQGYKVSMVKKGGQIQMQVDRIRNLIRWEVDGQLIKQQQIDCYSDYQLFLMIQLKDQWDKLQFKILS